MKKFDKDNYDLQADYKLLEEDRQPYLDRARMSSYYTINYIIMPESSDNNTKLVDLYSSVGSIGVNHLANKLLLALLPPNKLFFNYDIKPEIKLALGKEQVIELENLLRSFENILLTEINNSAIRNTIFNALVNLIIAGNSLLYVNEDNEIRNFTIEEYIIDRDAFGNVLKIVTKERISYQSMDEDLQRLVEEENIIATPNENLKKDEYTLFTGLILEDGEYTYFQQIENIIVEDTVNYFDKDKSPFLALRWNIIRSENYGRSRCDEVIGDLKTIQEASETIIVSAAIMSDIKFLVKPNSGINLSKLNNSPTGKYVSGNVDSIGVLQVNKSYDLQILRETLIETERRVNKHFLIFEARDSERTTNGEIDIDFTQLESSLGGVFSSLAESFQKPLVNIYVNTLDKNKKIPKLPVKSTDIKLKTGLEALGRNNEIIVLNTFLQQIEVFGEAAISQIDVNEYMRRIGDNLGIEDMNMLVKSKEQVSQEQSQAQEQQMIQQSTPGVMNELTKGMVQGELQKNDAQIKKEENS